MCRFDRRFWQALIACLLVQVWPASTFGAEEDDDLLLFLLPIFNARPSCGPLELKNATATGQVTLQVSCRRQPVTYTWYRNGSVIATTSVPTLTTTVPSNAWPATFSVTAAGRVGRASAASTLPALAPVTVMRIGSGFGNVSSNIAGLSCGTDCFALLETGKAVTLTANSVNGSTFSGWSGPCPSSTSSSCTFTVNSAATVKAQFDLPAVTSDTQDSDVVLTDTSTKAIGATGAVFNVDANGGANYTIPLALPPGIAGMKPDIGLSYNSQGGNGLLGVGWRVSGLSSITRCSLTEAQDGKRKAINYDADVNDDAFCLEGQRLIPISDRIPYNEVASSCSLTTLYKREYRTEIDGYSKIVAYEDHPCLLRGPSKWTVWTKDGRILNFGYYNWIVTDGWVIDPQMTDRPNNAMLWVLDRVEDRAGNYYFVEYEGNGAVVSGVPPGTKPNCVGTGTDAQAAVSAPLGELPYAEYRPKRICYTRNDNDPPGSAVPTPASTRIEFAYSDRDPADQQRLFDSGAGQVVVNKKLDSITVCDASDNCTSDFVRRYKLAYVQPPVAGAIRATAKTKIESVQECWGSGAQECLPKSTFAWTPGISGFVKRDGSLDPGSTHFVADFVGDGRSRVAYKPIVTPPPLSGSVQGLNICTVQADGTNPCVYWPITFSIGQITINATNFSVGDFNGDGRADVAYLHSNGTFDVCLSTGSSFQPCASWLTGIATDKVRHVADFNGDGKVDLLFHRGGNDWLVCISNGSGCARQATIQLPGTTENLMLGDFNGDGQADIVMGKANDATNSEWKFWFSDFGAGGSDAFLTTDTWVPGPKGTVRGGQVVVADFNGDGLADMASPADLNNVGAGNWLICESVGDGSFQRRVPLADNTTPTPDRCYVWSGGPTVGLDRTVFGDFNGDGRTDIAYTDGSYRLNICYVRGNDPFVATSTGFACEPVTSAGQSVRAPKSSLISSGDFMGIGISGMAYPPGYQVGETDIPSSLVVPILATVPDRIKTITNGLGATTTIEYAPLTDSTVYTKGTDANLTATELDIQSPMYVVKKATGSTGTGSVFAEQYRYAGLRGTTTGRGIQGFASRTVTDDNGIETTTVSYQSTTEWWKTGLPQSVTRKFGNTVLSQKTTTWEARAHPLTARVQQVLLTGTVETARDLDGTQLPTVTTVMPKANYTAWGDPGVSTATTTLPGGTTEFTKTTTSTYIGDEGNWVIGRPATISVTQTLSGSPAITRKTGFIYHGLGSSCTGGVIGSLCKETIEPDAASGSNAAQSPSWQETKYEYDSWGNRNRVSTRFMASTGNTETRAIVTAYGSDGRFATQVTNALGHIETRQYDTRLGLPTVVTGPNGDRVVLTYDALGRKLAETRYDANGHRVSQSAQVLETSGLMGTEVYAVHSYASGSGESIAYFDTLGREVRRRVTAFADNTWSESTVSYDALGRRERTKAPRGGATSLDNPLTTVFSYDALNRVKKVEIQDPAAPAALMPVVTTDYAGLVTTSTRTNPGGSGNQTTVTTANSQGWPVSVTDAHGKSTGFTYDSFGNRLVETGPTGIIRTAAYDGRGRKVSEHDNDTGWTTYTYNGIGELLSRKDAKNGLTEFQYDVLGRQILRRDSNSGSTTITTTTTTYDRASYGLGKANRSSTVETRSDGRATLPVDIKLTYDAAGRPSTRTMTVEGRDWETAYGYDANSRLATLRYPSGYAVKRTYNARGDLVSILGPTNQPHWQATERYLDGRLKRYTLGSSVNVLRGYDVLGRPASIVAGTSAAPQSLQNATYSFDGLGNLLKRQDTAPGLAEETFGYDLLNRLKSGTRGTTTVEAIDYDDAGNIVARSGVGTYSYITDSHKLQQVTGAAAASYGYDAAGNLTSRDGQTVATWTPFGQPERLTGSGVMIDYWYGADRSRIKEFSTSTGTILTIEPQQFEAFMEPGETTYSEFRHTLVTPDGPVGIIVTLPAAPATATENRYWLTDHIGSIAAVVASNGQLYQRMGYDAWGRRRGADGTSGPQSSFVTERGFTGHEMLDGIGLVNMNGRIYDPRLGRFLSADPIVTNPLNGQDYNRYSYVLNNPLSLTDPTGYSWWTSWGRTVAAIVVAYFTGYYNYGPVGGTPSIGVFGATSASSAAALGNAVAAGFAAGGIMGGNIESAIQGAFSGMLFYGIGTAADGLAKAGGISKTVFEHGGIGRVAMHAAAGCATSAGQGGSCRDGAIGAGFSEAVGPYLDSGNPVRDLAARTVAGGIGAKLSHGDASKGAFSAAFGYLFNFLSHAEYSLSSGNLMLVDGDTGSFVMADFKTATEGGLPLTPGQYDVLEGPRGTFRLERRDEAYGDDLDASTNQVNIRLHGPGNSLGCLTASFPGDWAKVESLLASTSSRTAIVYTYRDILAKTPLRAYSGDWSRYRTGTETLNWYGTLTVTK